METQTYTLWLVLLFGVVCGNWIPDTADSDSSNLPQQTRNSPSRRGNRANRHGRRRTPRLFDEFLKVIAVSGEIPDINADGSFSSQRGGNAAVPQQDSNSTSSAHSNADVRSSIRNYVRSHRPDVSQNIQQALQTETDNGNLPQGSGSANIQTSNIVEPLRRHTRRNAMDFANLEQSLQGIDRHHWSCCLLGQLAGDKGFLCDAQFYASRVLNRVANRVHNRRLRGDYFQDGAPTSTGQELITTFNDCVKTDDSANEFQTCCTETATEFERRQNRWRNFERGLRTNT